MRQRRKSNSFLATLLLVSTHKNRPPTADLSRVRLLESRGKWQWGGGCYHFWTLFQRHAGKTMRFTAVLAGDDSSKSPVQYLKSASEEMGPFTPTLVPLKTKEFTRRHIPLQNMTDSDPTYEDQPVCEKFLSSESTSEANDVASNTCSWVVRGASFGYSSFATALKL
jgi:hypothetical protein